MRFTSLLLLTATASAAGAQQTSPGAATGGTPPKVAIRSLGAVVATARDSLGMVTGTRALPGGRVLVNDMMRRRVVLLDASLGNAVTVVDSTAGAANSYGPRGGGLIPFRGDSTLFVDPTSLSMLVIDGQGKVARVMSVPRSDDAMSLAQSAFGAPGFDAQGRLVYRGSPRFSMRMAGAEAGAAARGGAAGGAATPRPQMPDTMALVRIDLATRAVDTVGWVKVPRPNMTMTQGEDGRMDMRIVMNPLPTVDDWAVTSEGAIAILRGRDYRIDWVHPDGSKSSTKLPFDWKRLSDDDKVAFIDSLKAARARQGENAAMPLVPGAPAMGGQMTITRSVEGGPPGGPPGGTRTEIRSGAGNVEWVPPSELPDYRPPFFSGAVRADHEGNLWIRTTTAPTVAGATVYDVVDRKGTLVDRVQVAGGRQVVGFGTDGTVLLAWREGTAARLEKAKLR